MEKNTYEIHQGKVGNLELTGDDASVQVIWNNIIGKYTKKGTDHLIYLTCVVMEEMFSSTRNLYLLKDGEVIEESDILSRVKKPLILGLQKFEDILIRKNGVLKPTAKTDSYIDVKDVTYHIVKMDEKGSRVFASFDNIIGSKNVAYIDNSTIPLGDTEVLEQYLEVIKNSSIDGLNLFLPSGEQLDKKLYDKVKKTLKDIGGFWSTPKQCFQFNYDPQPLVDKLLGGDKVNLKQDFQFFETSLELVDEIVKKADIQIYDKVLEPSAGQGAILNGIIRKHGSGIDVKCIEFMEQNRAILFAKPYAHELYTYLGKRVDDFLELDEYSRFDKILANPPFSKNQDITHVMKMYHHLNEGGKLVSIMSTSWVTGKQKKQVEFREFLNSVGAKQTPIEAGAFKSSGTNVATVIVEITKQ